MDQKCNACGKPRDVKDMWLAPDGENYCNHVSCYQVGVDREINYQRKRAGNLLASIENLLDVIQIMDLPLFNTAVREFLNGYLTAIIENGREE